MKRFLIALLAAVCLLLLGALSIKELEPTPPTSLVRVNTEMMMELGQLYKAEREKRLGGTDESPQMSPAAIRPSDATLIHINHPWTSTPVISADVTMAPPIERRLFSDNAVLDFNALYFNSPDPEQAVAFFLDPIWNRIIFANKSQNWIKSYGEWNGPPRNEYHLAGARALTIDISPHNTVYVADTENGRILKLQYGVSYLGGEGSYSFAVLGIWHPVDICLPCMGDGIWIADDWTGKLVETTRPSGGDVQILNTVQSYRIGGQTYSLARPRTVACENWPWPRLAFVDGETNTFVVGNPESILGTTIDAWSATEFTQQESRLERVGVDATQNWWVADPGLGKIHTFDVNGSYLASFNPPVPVNMISTSPCYDNGSSLEQPLEIFTAEPWSNTNGLRAYFPGADVLGMEVEETANHFRLTSILTNLCFVKVKVVRADSGNVVQTLYDGGSLATIRTDEVAKSSLQHGNYKFRVEVLPMHSSDYGQYQVDWLVREIPFTYTVLPAPQSLSATGYPGNVYLTWSAVSGADRYRIYCDGFPVAYRAGTNFWHSTEVYGQPLEYFVTACNGSYEGPPSATATAVALHLQSSTAASTAPNNQRKMVKMWEATYPESFLYYVSNSEVWEARMAAGTSEWGPEFLVSDGSGTATAPSVATNADEGEVYCVYRQGSDVYFREQRLDSHGGTVWYSPVQLNDTYPAPNAHPVITRTHIAEYELLVFWEGEFLDYPHVILFRTAQRVEGNWVWNEFFYPNVFMENFNKPSVTPQPDENSPYWLYLTADNENDIVLFPFHEGINYDETYTVPASAAPQSFSAQVSGQSLVGSQEEHRIHIAWEALSQAYPPPPATDAGDVWTDAGPPERYIVMYQGLAGVVNGTAQWTTSDAFVNGSSGDFYHPTITHLANGTLLMAWDDGSTAYQAVRTEEDDQWRVTEVYDNLVNPNFTDAGREGSLNSSLFVATEATGTPHGLQFGIEVGDAARMTPHAITEQYNRRVVAAKTAKYRKGQPPPADTTSFFAVDLGQITLKLHGGNTIPVSYAPVQDGEPGITEGNAWDKLATVTFTLPADVDSVLIRGSANVISPQYILDRSYNSLRLAFDLIDAGDSSVIQRLGNERIFGRDTVHVLDVRAQVTGLAGREVYIRPKVLGVAGNRSDITYSLVHVRTLLKDTTEVGAGPSLAKGEEKGVGEIPTEYALHQNYPNPFNPTTRINVDLPEPATISLVIYDILGKEVAILARGQYDAGKYGITWDAHGCASGIYFARFIARNQTGEMMHTKTHKLVLAR